MRIERESIACIALAVVAGCGSCGSGPEALRAPEPHPHVRCLGSAPPEEGTRALGALSIEVEERTLSVTSQDAPVRFAAFGGPAPAALDAAEQLSAIGESGVSFVVVLGDFGDDAETLEASLAALSELSLPVFLVPGGRDDATLLEEALSELDDDTTILDVSGLDRIVVGGQSLVPIAGAPRGRYGRTDDACGFTASDLSERAERISTPAEGERRYLLSWTAPFGGIAVGIAGADAGDEALAEFATSIGASGGLYAWPREAAGRVVGEGHERAEVLRRIAGPVAVRGDGERPAVGPSFFSIGPDGLASP